MRRLGSRDSCILVTRSVIYADRQRIANIFGHQHRGGGMSATSRLSVKSNLTPLVLLTLQILGLLGLSTLNLGVPSSGKLASAWDLSCSLTPCPVMSAQYCSGGCLASDYNFYLVLEVSTLASSPLRAARSQGYHQVSCQIGSVSLAAFCILRRASSHERQVHMAQPADTSQVLMHIFRQIDGRPSLVYHDRTPTYSMSCSQGCRLPCTARLPPHKRGGLSHLLHGLTCLVHQCGQLHRQKHLFFIGHCTALYASLSCTCMM